jgi:Zn-dependent alcohol dehydrogenase
MDVDRPFDLVDDLDVATPMPGQVRVRITQCGLCHSDLTSISGGFGTPFPVVLGHEAAGEVESVGDGVTHVSTGDKVVITPMPSCGRCHACVTGNPSVCVVASMWPTGLFPDGTSPFSLRGALVYRGNGIGACSELTVVDANAAVKVPDDTPLDLACLIGCAVQTGTGAALNVARVTPGSTVLVMGLGGIGQAVVQGARIAGAAQIIVSDPLPERREIALALGGTDAIDPTEHDVVREVRALTDRAGVDYAFDAAGSPELVAVGVRATAPGGAIVLVGAPRVDATLDTVLHGQVIGQQKRLLGTVTGNCDAARDFPRFLALWRSGRLDLEHMVSYRRPLAEINEGFDDLRAGRGVRTVLTV